MFLIICSMRNQIHRINCHWLLFLDDIRFLRIHQTHIIEIEYFSALELRRYVTNCTNMNEYDRIRTVFVSSDSYSYRIRIQRFVFVFVFVLAEVETSYSYSYSY